MCVMIQSQANKHITKEHDGTGYASAPTAKSREGKSRVQKGMHKLRVHPFCNSVKTFTPPLHECRNICMVRWTTRLLFSVGVAA